jgi:hypothetical protein
VREVVLVVAVVVVSDIFVLGGFNYNFVCVESVVNAENRLKKRAGKGTLVDLIRSDAG